MQDIVARINSLGELVDDLMIYARPRPPRPGEAHVHALITDAITLVRRDPAAAQISISLTGDDAAMHVDAELIRAALVNLLLNAAHAVGAHGTVVVRTVVASSMVTVEIRDNGPGIPMEIRERVLEPFFTTKSRGGGLGLPIARRSAELHGGSLSLSCPDQGGTVVTLTLPIRVVAARTSRSDT
jgi:nitrogen fixation/metabolism regulation signal transduction histidine kinase